MDTIRKHIIINQNKLMRLKFSVLLLMSFLIFSCNRKQKELTPIKNPSEQELLIKKLLERDKNYGLSETGLKPLKQLKNRTLRIWCHYGGGANFSQIYELNIEKSELKFYSYLRSNADKNQLESLPKFQKITKNIIDREVIEEFIVATNDNLFLDIKNSYEYCNVNRGCGDSFDIEYIDKNKIKTFSVNDHIKNCSNKEAKLLKNFYSIIEKLIEKTQEVGCK
jgi:hypothetical protein